MGRTAWIACALAAVAGCFADLGGLSGGGDASDGGAPPAEAGGDDAPTPPRPDPPGTPPPPPPVDAGVDATVFADSFDDMTPLPRGWDSTTGIPTVVSTLDAPSAPNVLDTLVSGDAGAGTFIKKTISTFGAKRVWCTFAVQLVVGSGINYVVSTRLEVDAQTYVRLDLAPDAWHYYGQQGLTEYSGRVMRDETGVWNHVTLSIAIDGTVTVTVDADTRTSMIAPLTAGSIHFSAGIQYPIDPDTIETRYDDVRCAAE